MVKSSERPDPERLMADARLGKSERLGELLELYRNYLRLLARTQIDLHLQGRVNPSDLVQETFLEAYRDFVQFRGKTEKEWLAWLRRILVHNLARLVEQQVKALKRDARREVSLHRVDVAALDRDLGPVRCRAREPPQLAQRAGPAPRAGGAHGRPHGPAAGPLSRRDRAP